MYNFIDQSHRQGICILYMFKHFDSVYLTLQKKCNENKRSHDTKINNYRY